MQAMRQTIARACALLLLSGPAAIAGPTDKTPVAVSGLNYFAQNADRDWSLNLKGNPPCIYRFEVHPGDRWMQEVQKSSVDRSELRGPTDDTNAAHFNAETWTAYQFKIEPGPASTAVWVVLGDWHVQPDPGDTAIMSSPWQLELRNGDILVFDIRASSEKPVRDIAPEQHIYTSPAPITRGIWHSLVSVANFDSRPRGDGGVTVWLDGNQIVNYHGALGYITSRQNYFKFGIYRATAPETLAVDYKNVEISRASLAARVHSPPAACAAK
jgi:hypothetical protein